MLVRVMCAGERGDGVHAGGLVRGGRHRDALCLVVRHVQPPPPLSGPRLHQRAACSEPVTDRQAAPDGVLPHRHQGDQTAHRAAGHPHPPTQQPRRASHHYNTSSPSRLSPAKRRAEHWIVGTINNNPSPVALPLLESKHCSMTTRESFQ
jgi:hypothetical protein